ncbi:MAG: DUF4159 domain-containing protein [Kiritimatiellia bacterium]|nr:DUF4159 domain-containing protein [Kiritimatiellia bacterium]MDP6810893.1 DUF4159 domain-containing protein [Kiritimatiellia bacterium]MDP7023389.1 DUF4159 domain-containing protein [Kiritimatiellia bacterium]
MSLVALLSVGLSLLLIVPSAHAGWLQKGVKKEIKTFDGRSKADKDHDRIDRRGKVTIRRLRPRCHSDWSNDPTALPYFFYQVSLRTQNEFPVFVDNAGLDIDSEDIFNYPIIYFTSHYPFSFTDDEVENLKKYLKRGGTLWLDDCTGSGPFMESVPQNVQRIAPGAEIKQMLPTPEFSDLYNIVYPFSGVPQVGKEQFCRPMQAAYINGRPAIIFCPNDYGCFWEISTPPTALNPMGEGAHNYVGDGGFMVRDTVYKFSINWLFYTLTH